MIIKIHSDKQKSNSLKKMAEITLERLRQTDAKKYPTNTLNDYYDIIHKLPSTLLRVYLSFLFYLCLLYFLKESPKKF